MNDVPSVGTKLAARVREAARELNYQPNIQARSLGSGRTRLIGLIITDITNPFFPDMVRSFELTAVGHGYEILMASLSDDPASVDRCMKRMLERRVDGIAAMTFGVEKPILEHLSARPVPIVFVNFDASLRISASLTVNYQHGIRQAVQHLAVLGHRDIGFLAGPLHEKVVVERLRAFQASMAEIGIEVPKKWILEGDYTLEGGITVTEKLLRQSHQPTAMICLNDLSAIGVLHAVMNQGLMVPDYLSVIGFDNIRLAAYTYPPLTTVDMPRDELAVSAVQALISMIEGGVAPPRKEITTQLVVRRTTGTPRLARLTPPRGPRIVTV